MKTHTHTHTFDLVKLQTLLMAMMINALNRMCLSSKALIQLMAAAVADRDMAYFTFGNEHLAYEVQRMHEILTQNRVTVGTYCI